MRLLAITALLLLSGCLSEPPASSGESTQASDMAAAYRRGDCAEVLRLAPTFSASTDTQLRVVTVWVGSCLRRTGKYIEAVQTLAPVADAVPPVRPTPRARLETGRAWYDATAYADAHEALEQVVTEFPRHSLVDDATYYDGNALRHLHRYDEAVARFDAAEQSTDSTAFRRGGARYYRGVTRVASGQFDVARADFEAAIAGSGDTPFAAKARLALARLPLDEGDCAGGESSLVAFAEAAGTDDEAALGYLERARAVLSCGEAARAETLLQAVEADFPTSASADDARLEWARIDFARARAADAINDPSDKALYASARSRFEGLLSDYPASTLATAAHLHIGRCWLETRAFDLAIAEFDALAAAPWTIYLDNATYYAGLARYLRRGPVDLDAAVATFDRVLGLPGPSTYADDAAYYRGRSFDLLARKSEALTAFRDLLVRFPTSPLRDNALFYVAALSVAAGDCTSAVAALTQLRLEAPDSTYVSQTELIVSSCGPS